MSLGLSLLCSNFIYCSFKNFPKKHPIILFLIPIPSLLFHNNAPHEIMWLLYWSIWAFEYINLFSTFTQYLYDIAGYKLFLVAKSNLSFSLLKVDTHLNSTNYCCEIRLLLNYACSHPIILELFSRKYWPIIPEIMQA